MMEEEDNDFLQDLGELIDNHNVEDIRKLLVFMPPEQQDQLLDEGGDFFSDILENDDTAIIRATFFAITPHIRDTFINDLIGIPEEEINVPAEDVGNLHRKISLLRRAATEEAEELRNLLIPNFVNDLLGQITPQMGANTENMSSILIRGQRLTSLSNAILPDEQKHGLDTSTEQWSVIFNVIAHNHGLDSAILQAMWDSDKPLFTEPTPLISPSASPVPIDHNGHNNGQGQIL